MISATKTDRFGRPVRSPRDGFTLLEIVMVLAIVAMVIGGAVAMMVYSSSERQLRRASVDIEVMAKRARTIALLQQKPYAIVFMPGKIRLMPLAETTGVEDSLSSSRGSTRSSHSAEKPSEDDQPSPSAAAQQPVYDEIPVNSDMTLNVRRWASDKWLPMDERRPQIWRFDPEGLCEPISVRLVYEESWIEDTFNPLTASIADSATEFK
ncbi:pilus assembly FimT family protein [Luteolibacter ambystomatis]|nr:prepilin-type N-terminal cleavage/methylation domain-containing protein [Luteolibacter ambystomatis]